MKEITMGKCTSVLGQKYSTVTKGMEYLNCYLLPNLDVMTRNRIGIFEKMSNAGICCIFFALNINFNSVKDFKKILNVTKIENSKESGTSAEVKFVFSGNPLQNETSLQNWVKKYFYGKTNSWFCSNAFTRVWVLNGRLGAMLYLHSILKIFRYFLIS